MTATKTALARPRLPETDSVWRFAEALAKQLDKMHPELITAEYRVAIPGSLQA